MDTTTYTSPNPEADATLVATLADEDAMPGNRRRAYQFLRLASDEDRLTASCAATLRCNLTPGWRPSDALGHEVDVLLRQGAAPGPGGEYPNC